MTPMSFIYTNHRGETAERQAIPLGVRFGATQWHPEPQWLMRAFDLDKGEEREFAMADFTGAADAENVVLRERIASLEGERDRLEANQMAAVQAAFREGHADAQKWDSADDAWRASALNGAIYDPETVPKAQAPASTGEAAQWEGEVCHFLDNCPYTIRMCEGGGPEDIHGSLALTVGKMEHILKTIGGWMEKLAESGSQQHRDEVIMAARLCVPRAVRDAKAREQSPRPDDVDLLRLRFFRDLTDEQRQAVYHQAGMDLGDQPFSHGIEYKLFANMITRGKADLIREAVIMAAAAQKGRGEAAK